MVDRRVLFHQFFKFLLANLFGVLLFVPFLISGRYQVYEIVVQFWPFLLLTGFFQALYFLGLAYAYKTGELSIAYPLARSVPALLVTIVVLLSGHGGAIGTPVLYGVALIVLGGFLLPLESFRDFSLQRYKNVAVVAALVAAAGTTG